MGSMFVVAPYTGDGTYPTNDAELKEVRFNTKRSSLSAVGWGLAYPDLFRTMPLFGAGVPEKLDRGWSLENSWSTVWRDAHLPTPRLTRWRQDVYDGVRPAVIINATASESGERFLIASTDAPFEGARQFSQFFLGRTWMYRRQRGYRPHFLMLSLAKMMTDFEINSLRTGL
jgi:hypothetical protein